MLRNLLNVLAVLSEVLVLFVASLGPLCLLLGVWVSELMTFSLPISFKKLSFVYCHFLAMVLLSYSLLNNLSLAFWNGV